MRDAGRRRRGRGRETGDWRMFTGIIKAIGVVRSVRSAPGGIRLVVEAPGLARPIARGASIAVDGACLTVVESDAPLISFDVVFETLRCSTLGSFRPGRRVNLEPGLRLGDPMDGHQVQGHVEGTGRVRRLRKDGERWEATISADPSLMPAMIPKGSVAVDGVSLTIAEAGADDFTVALIPTTRAETTLGELELGRQVNLETDILVRTVLAALGRCPAARLEPAAEAGFPGIEVLRENGW